MKKTKKRNKKSILTTVKPKSVRAKKYESHWLAVILVAFVLLQGYLMTSTEAADWQKGITLLDIGESVEQTISDVVVIMEPVAIAVEGINQFFQLAATEMTLLLDLSESDPLAEVNMITEGISAFYSQAAVQLASLLDLSSLPGNVAGAYTSAF